jgi:hypothetical protein
MKILCVGLLLASMTSVALGQTSAYQDADGLSSIYLANAKASLTYNVSSSTFNIGYLYEGNAQKKQDYTKQKDAAQIKLDAMNAALQKAQKDPTSNPEVLKAAQDNVNGAQTELDKINNDIKNAAKAGACPRCEFGITVSGKPSTNLTTQFFQNSNSPASVTGGGAFGIHRVFSKDIWDPKAADDPISDDWFLLNVSYTGSTFDTVATGATTPTTQHFNGFTILPTYNMLTGTSWFSLLAGVAGGVTCTNNSGSLTKVEISTSQASSGTVSVVSQKDAYQGTYQESIGVPIYSDFVFFPVRAPWLTFDAFERANVISTNGYSEGGVGVFFAKPDNPTAVLGGLSVDWKNGKREIAVVAGWSF